MGIKREDFKMEQGLDTIGEHFVSVTYSSDHFQKDFAFFVKVQIRGRAKIAPPAGKETGAAQAK
jgi:hypothetical protein